ncbi:MAG TPA: OmpA family protein [Phycisphaerae bacterium]|nr:OmpA family protein [Phycisphaerae bacterium]
MKPVLKWPTLGIIAMLFTVFMGGCQDDKLVAERNQLLQQNQQLKQQLDQANADLASARTQLAQAQAAQMAAQNAGQMQEQGSTGNGESNILPSFGNNPGGQQSGTEGPGQVTGETTGGGELHRFVLSSDLLFASGSAHLAPSASHQLTHVADMLNSEYAHRQIVIEGYTDNRPIHHTYPNNYALGLARARAVEHYLETHGVSADRMKAVSYGDTHLISTTDLSLDRRVEIVVLR